MAPGKTRLTTGVLTDSFKFPGGGRGRDPHSKGWFETEAALIAEYPEGVAGDWAIVGDTNTVWIWDPDFSPPKWKNTGKGAIVTWGGITGTLSAQGDLQGALDEKVDKEEGKSLVSNEEKDVWNDKQDKLTAGDNIEIDEYNEISAQDTTYEASDFDIKDLADTDGKREEWDNKQDKLTAGDNIEIDEYNEISAQDTTYESGDFNLSDLGDVINTDKGEGKILKVDSGGNHIYVDDETGTDEKVKYKSDDPTAGYLNEKVIAGDGIVVAEGTEGDANKLKVSADISDGETSATKLWSSSQVESHVEGETEGKADKTRTVAEKADATFNLNNLDAFKEIRFTLDGNQTLTILDNATEPIAIGTDFLLQGYGTGTKTIEPDTDVTLNGGTSSFVLDSQYSGAVLRKIGTNEWLIVGAVN